jgi:putative radical SAM enzyme (TIGR03279 family)
MRSNCRLGGHVPEDSQRPGRCLLSIVLNVSYPARETSIDERDRPNYTSIRCIFGPWFRRMAASGMDSQPKHGGLIASIEPDGLAADLALQPGDELVSINGHPLRDVIDVQFYAADEQLEFLIRRDGKLIRVPAERDYEQPLGIEFSHPTFDIDIRRCNNLCEFCFVLQTAPRMRRTLYIKDDDYRYSFLQGHYVTLTNLSDEDWRRIEEQHLSPLYVSVHATDLELRRRILRNPNAPDVMDQLGWLSERGFEVHTQIVVTPEMNDGPHLDRSISDLANLWPAVQSVSIVPVGITKHHKYGHRPNTPEESRRVFQQVSHWQDQLHPRLGVRFAYLTDEWYLSLNEPIPEADDYDGLDLQENGLGMVRDFLDDWEFIRSEALPQIGIRRLTWVTATLFAPLLTTLAHEFGVLTGLRAEVIPIANQRLGDTITVAGLLMGQDVIEQLHRHDLGDLVVLPRIMFDHPEGIALDDVSPTEIAQEVDRPVVLTDTMGDLWQAIGSARG